VEAKTALKNRNSDLPVALREGEKVLGRAVVAYGIYWKSLAVFTLAAMVAFLAIPLGIFLAGVAFAIFIYEFLLRKLLLMFVTNQRVILRSGIIKIDTVQIRLDRIESVEIQRTLVGQIMGYATILITGTGTRLAFIPYLANAPQIRNILDDILYQREKLQEAEAKKSAELPVSTEAEKA
jgi:uncharacterized membrane protein YdbT with pleckstrin-like domain